MSSVQMVKPAETIILGYIEEADSIQPKMPRKLRVQTPAAGLRPPHVVALVSPGVSHFTSYTVLTHT